MESFQNEGCGDNTKHCNISKIGPTGPPGIRGPTGLRGHHGPTGQGGCRGHHGPTGPDGCRGHRGHHGEQGPTGRRGVDGPTGPQGMTGHCGPRGPTGCRGRDGPTGKHGERGHRGHRGNCGSTGKQGIIGPTGTQGPKGATGCRGPTGAHGSNGGPGATGATGPTGRQGIAGPTGESGVERIFYHFASNQIINDQDYMSQGSSSTDFKKNTLIVAENSSVVKMVFSIRDLILSGITGPITAELWKSAGGMGPVTGTGIIASIPNGAIDICAVATGGPISLLQCDLISVRITTNGGVLDSGACVSLHTVLS